MTEKETRAKELDQFFTKPDIAERFCREVDRVVGFKNYDNIIEPSAGSGMILQFLPEDKRIGLDLEPQHPEVKEMNFFHYHFPVARNCVVGNPPFGSHSKLAIEFFNACAWDADVIAFIIPRSWIKPTVQNSLSGLFGLAYHSVLPDESFLHNGEPYVVNCCAQIWVKGYNGPTEWDSWHEELPKELVAAVGEAYKGTRPVDKGTQAFVQRGSKMRFTDSPEDFTDGVIDYYHLEPFECDFSWIAKVWSGNIPMISRKEMGIIRDIYKQFNKK